MKIMTKDETPLVDLSLIRKDILELFKKVNKVLESLFHEFIIQNPAESINVMDAMNRVQVGNRQYLLDRKEPNVQISSEEIAYLGRMERHSQELAAELMD
jgi:hypothetical protein